jgi:hypothetical protein
MGLEKTHPEFLMKTLAFLLIRFYQLAISPYWPGQCRYEPTCSVYAQGAIKTHGVFSGVRMAASRIGRCHPGHEGGYDPVPEANPRSPGNSGISGE